MDPRENPNDQEGPLAHKGDLDPSKYAAWLASIKKDYYNHTFFKGVIPLAVDPPDDRTEGILTNGALAYNTRRNAGDLDLLADIEAYGAGLTSQFFNFVAVPLGATPKLYQDDTNFSAFFLRGPDPTTLELVTNEDMLPEPLKQTGRSVPSSGALPPDFQKALQDSRVFQVDFSKYAGVTTPPRFASWPHAVFMSTPAADSFGQRTYRLVPVAIFEKTSGKCVFPKSSASEWEFAKREMLTAALQIIMSLAPIWDAAIWSWSGTHWPRIESCRRGTRWGGFCVLTSSTW